MSKRNGDKSYRYKTRGRSDGTGFGMGVHSYYENNEYESCYTCVHCADKKCTVKALSIWELGKRAAWDCRYYSHNGNAEILNITGRRLSSTPDPFHREKAIEAERKKGHYEKSVKVKPKLDMQIQHVSFGQGRITRIQEDKVTVVFKNMKYYPRTLSWKYLTEKNLIKII